MLSCSANLASRSYLSRTTENRSNRTARLSDTAASRSVIALSIFPTGSPSMEHRSRLRWLSRPRSRCTICSPIRALSSAKVLYCGRDLHFLRMMRQSTVESDQQTYAKALNSEAIERSLISNADATLVFSSVERQVIAERFGIRDKARVVPAYVYDRVGPGPVDPPLSERRNVLFVGGFGHPPNIDAVNWFAKEVWPAVARAFPAAVCNRRFRQRSTWYPCRRSHRCAWTRS